MENLKTGDKYKHYKNQDHFYEIIGVAFDSETLKEMVIYKALYEIKDFGMGTLWARPKEIFLGTVIVDGKEIKRFEKVN